MARQTETKSEAIDQLWHRLDDTRTGMLWIDGSDQHPQPMSHFADHDANALWFVTASDTDLARSLTVPAEARFVYVSSKQDYHASLTGRLSIVDNPEKLDDLWNFAIAAWFEDGREDDKVRLLKLDLREAAVWASSGNAVLVGLKMLKAAMDDDVSEPNVGVHHILNLAA